MGQKIEITNNWTIQKVFNELENGNMKIPRFQRGYVWERSKIVKLLNSIYREHPIGSIFIWEASSGYADFCREIEDLGFPGKPEANKFKFIIDGQQRITSLYVALMGKKLGGVDYSTICFNLDKRRFQIPTLKTEQNNVPAWKIFNQAEAAKLLKSYSVYDFQNGTKYWDALNECQNVFNTYPMSLIKTLDVELEEAVTIFENINQGGKRLSLFDLVHASVWTKDFDLRDLIQEFNDEPSIKIFGGLQSETFTQSLSLNALDNCQKTNQLNLTTNRCKNVWDRTLECLRLAIDLIGDYGAVKNDILPYESIIPVIQYYYFKSGKNNIENAHKLLIDDWYWTTVFSRRYSSSTLTRMKEDADWIGRIINGDNEPRVFGITLTCQDLRRINMKNKSVIKDGVLCILAANNPVDFNNGQGVKLDKTNASRANAKENHHFFPYSRHDDFGITQDAANSLLNFAFISKTLNIAISNKLPSEYLSEYAKENPKLAQCLDTHFINTEAYTFAIQNDFDSFVEARGKLILDKINTLCKVKTAIETMADITDEEFDSSDDLLNEEVVA